MGHEQCNSTFPINEKEECDPHRPKVRAGRGPKLPYKVKWVILAWVAVAPTPFLVIRLQSPPNPALHLANVTYQNIIPNTSLYIMGRFPTILAVFEISSPPRKPII